MAKTLKDHKSLTYRLVFNLLFGDQVDNVEAQSKVYLLHNHGQQIMHAKGPAHNSADLYECSISYVYGFKYVYLNNTKVEHHNKDKNIIRSTQTEKGQFKYQLKSCYYQT